MPAPRPDPFQLSLQPGPDDDITTPTTIRRDRPSLLDQLRIIDTEGWDGPAGTRLLQYLRTELVRPLTIHLGLRGAAASQAEATAWEAVWLEATNPSLRTAQSPWGVLWRTARRAVLNEVVATRFASSPCHGWILAAATRRGQEHPLTGDAPEQLWDHLAALVASDGYRLERGPCAGCLLYTSPSPRD